MTQTTYYTIRNVRTGLTVNCYEGEAKQHAYDMVALHNRLFPNDPQRIDVEVE